jgi:glycosyltransferase involved in cell wall biosynthesis
VSDVATHRPRVVHVLMLDGAGGVETFIRLAMGSIDPVRFELAVITVGAPRPLTRALEALGVPVHFAPRWRLAPRELAAWWRTFRRIRGDVVHFHLGGRAVRTLARLAGARQVLLHVHGPEDDWGADGRRSPDKVRRAAGAYAGGTDRVLCCSEHVAALLAAARPPLTPRIDVVHYGVDLALFDLPEVHEAGVCLRKELAIAARAPVVAFVGRFHEQKGIDALVEVVRTVHHVEADAHFIIVGSGPLQPMIDALVTETGSRRVHVMGWRQDVPAVLAASDVLLLPSAWEGLPLVGLEAMASSRPIVAFAVDGVPEEVVHGVTGLLAAPGDRPTLTTHLLRLVRDRDERNRLGAAGRRRLEERFLARTMGARLEDIYIRSLARPRAR